MPYNEQKNIAKKYYTIGEVAKILAIKPSLIRFWEKKFVHIKPYKSPLGTRRYTAQNIAQIQHIHQLVREQGYTIKGALTQLKKKFILKEQETDELIIALKKIKNYFIYLKSKAKN